MMGNSALPVGLAVLRVLTRVQAIAKTFDWHDRLRS